MRMIVLPRLYSILDASFFASYRDLITAAEELAAAGVTLIQYRNKSGNARVMLEQARELRRHFPAYPEIANSATLRQAQQVFRMGHPQFGVAQYCAADHE